MNSNTEPMTNQLTKQTQFKEPLTPMAHELFEAKSGIKIFEMPDHRLVRFVDTIVTSSYARLGHANPDEIVEAAAKQTIQQELLTHYKHWTEKEVAFAFRLGSEGKLDTNEVHFTARAAIKWLLRYKESYRGKLSAEIASKLIPEKAESKPFNREDAARMLDNFFDLWSKKGSKHIAGFYEHYIIARKLKLIRLTADRFMELVPEAIKYRLEQLDVPADNKTEAKFRSDQIELIKSYDTSNTDPNKVPNYIKYPLGEMVLIRWFEELKEFDQSPKSIAA